MSAAVFRLLRAYLGRSGFLYGIIGVVQFCMSGLYWTRGVERVSVPAALLSLWGLATAFRAHSLVWRSLPLTARDASLFRWWALAGAPMVFVAAIDSIAWLSQLTTQGLPVPTPAVLLQSIVAAWAAMGVVAALPVLGRRRAQVRGWAVAALVLVLGYASWLIYGIPSYAASPTLWTALTAAELSLLVLSGVWAARGRLWYWPDIASRGVKPQRLAGGLAGTRFGVSAVLMPLLKRTAVFALMASGGIVLLYRLFPSASAVLFWSYFVAISTAGFLLTYQVRSALPTLRILPLSVRQLAGMLQFFGALPGIATLGLTLLLNVTLLHVKLDPAEFATFALIIIASQIMPVAKHDASLARFRWEKWVGLLQRIYMPFYIGIVVLNYGGAWARWWWFRWPLICAGIVLCVVGYCTLVRQLRSGVRPSSNENAFSPA